MGIIAVLIGLLTEQVPAVLYVEDGQTVVLVFDGTEFRPVGLMEEDGIWSEPRPGRCVFPILHGEAEGASPWRTP